MVYSDKETHFYGTGTADPLREDISLRSLEAKSTRFECFASLEDCTVHNLSEKKESRLVFKRKEFKYLDTVLVDAPREIKTNSLNKALNTEAELNYFIDDGKYWKHEHKFDAKKIDQLDKIWLNSLVK